MCWAGEDVAQARKRLQRARGFGASLELDAEHDAATAAGELVRGQVDAGNSGRDPPDRM